MLQTINWIKVRLSEPSTWAGIGVASAAVEVALQNHYTLYAAIIAGVMAFILPENK